MNKMQQLFAKYPALIGVVVSLVGLFLFLGAVFDWNWMFGDVSRATYDPGKIDGLVNLFGRKTARIVFGIFCFFVFLLGIFVIWYSIRSR